LSTFALSQASPNRHAVQSGDCGHLLDAAVPMLSGQHASKQPSAALVQFGHHAVDGPVVRYQFRITA
jgi:hypothetical protein